MRSRPSAAARATGSVTIVAPMGPPLARMGPVQKLLPRFGLPLGTEALLLAAQVFDTGVPRSMAALLRWVAREYGWEAIDDQFVARR